MSDRVARGFAWNHVYKIVEYGLVNLYTILVVRKFGPELAGGYAVYLSISGTLAILAAFGVDGVLLRFLPRVARGESKIGDVEVGGLRPFILQLFSFRMAVTAILCLLVAVVLWILPIAIPELAVRLGTIRTLWPYLILFLIGQGAVAFSTFTLIGLLQVKWVFFASLVTRLALVAAGLLYVLQSKLTLEYAVAFHAASALLNGGLLLMWVHKKVAREDSKGIGTDVWHFARHVLRFVRRPGHFRLFVLTPFMLYGITTWGSDLLSAVLGRQPDILMMRAMLGEQARDIGLYQSAAQLVLMTEYIFLFGLGGTLVSVFSELVHRDEESGPSALSRYPRLFQARKDIAGFQSVSTAPLFAFMLVFAPLVTQAIYGDKFHDAVPYVITGLSILSGTVLIFGGGMQITSLVVIGKERVVFRNRLAWGVVNLIANYFLIAHFGGLGAMIGTQLANAGACMTEGLFASRWIGNSFEWKRTLLVIAIVGIAVTLTAIVVSFIPVNVEPLLRSAVAACLMALLTLGGYALFRVPDARKVFDKVRSVLPQNKKLAPNS